MEFAIEQGQHSSEDLAELAWILIQPADSKVVYRNRKRAHDLVVNQSCIHCEGVLARCLIGGYGCDKNIPKGAKLAEKSAVAGSKYGQYIWGFVLLHCTNKRVGSKAAGERFHELAKVQGLDWSHIPNSICARSKVADRQHRLKQSVKHVMCHHNKRKSVCDKCGGGSLCEHGKQKQWCRICRPFHGTGSARCQHGKQKSRCVTCKGVGICEHEKLRHRCKICVAVKRCTKLSTRICKPYNERFLRIKFSETMMSIDLVSVSDMPHHDCESSYYRTACHKVCVLGLILCEEPKLCL